MSEFSRAGSGPIASLARCYGITRGTPGDWALVSVPRLLSSGHDRLVNAGGRWETKAGRAKHCQQSVHEVAEAFSKSLMERAPRISGAHRQLLAQELADVVDGVFTVQCMRERVEAEKREFAAFCEYAIEEFSMTGTASRPAVRSLLSLDFAGLPDDTDDEAPLPGDQPLKASDFATRAVDRQAEQAQFQAFGEEIIRDSKHTKPGHPQAMVPVADEPQDDDAVVRFHVVHGGPVLRASDFATPSRPGQPAAASRQPSEAGSPPAARVEHKRQDLPLDQRVGAQRSQSCAAPGPVSAAPRTSPARSSS